MSEALSCAAVETCAQHGFIVSDGATALTARNEALCSHDASNDWKCRQQQPGRKSGPLKRASGILQRGTSDVGCCDRCEVE